MAIIQPTKVEIRTKHHNEMVEITEAVRRTVIGTKIREGICTVFVPHTTAGITINENVDPDVKHDMIMGFSEMVSETNRRYRHAEGNSPGHIKSTIFGQSENIIISKGDLLLGTWQGIFFCEWDGPRKRNIYIKILEG